MTRGGGVVSSGKVVFDLEIVAYFWTPMCMMQKRGMCACGGGGERWAYRESCQGACQKT
jgi:hypothetical protein